MSIIQEFQQAIILLPARVAVGYSKAEYFLGIGGLSKGALVNDARRNLMMNEGLEGKYIANMVVDFKQTWVWPYKKREVTIIADVVEVEGSELARSEKYKRIINGYREMDSTFNIGTEIISIYSSRSSELYKGKIAQIMPDDITLVIFHDDRIQTKKIDKKYVFIKKTPEEIKNALKIDPDKEVKGKVLEDNKNYWITGKIIGYSKYYVLIVSDASIYYMANRNSIKQLEEE